MGRAHPPSYMLCLTHSLHIMPFQRSVSPESKCSLEKHSQVTLLLGPEKQLETSTGHAQAQACLLCHAVPVTALVLKS